MILDRAKIENVEIEGIDLRDWPNLSDSYISAADYDGEPMTDQQLDEINEDSEFVYNHAIESCF